MSRKGFSTEFKAAGGRTSPLQTHFRSRGFGGFHSVDGELTDRGGLVFFGSL